MYDRVVTEHPDKRLPRAVVFRDSFASALIPFLSEHFSRAVYLWQNDFDPDVIEQEHPDVVIQEIVSRHLYVFTPSPELIPN
jgi:alginate O-acetyltransferase complex protein AlgJ